MSGDSFLDQNEIERLLSGGAAQPAPPPEPSPPAVEVSASASAFLDQSELDALMSGIASSSKTAATKPAASVAQKSAPVQPQPVQSPPPRPASPPVAPVFQSHIAQHAEPVGDEDGIPHGDLNYLLKRANEAIQSIAATKPELPAEVVEFQFPEFGGSTPSSDHATLDQISEVELDVKIELGRSQMYLEDVLSLRRGSVVALDKMAGDAVDIYVNGRLLARGEVLVMNENFCVRVAELLAGTIPIE